MNVHWAFDWKVDKYDSEMNFRESEQLRGNLLTTLGANLLLNLFIEGGGTSMSAANARIGVGDSATAETVGQTDLQAVTNKLRRPVDSAVVSTNTATWVATFGSTDALWVWKEVALFNAQAAGTMVNRRVDLTFNGGVAKVSGEIWIMTAVLKLF